MVPDTVYSSNLFGDGEPESCSVDEDEPSADENSSEPNGKINSEAEMHSGFVFEFTRLEGASVSAAHGYGEGGGTACMVDSAAQLGMSADPSSRIGALGAFGTCRITPLARCAALSTRESSQPRRRWPGLRVALGLLIAITCLARGVWSANDAPAPKPGSQAMASAGPALRPIESIRVGDRVITDKLSRMQSDTEVDPATWRLVRLTGDVREEDGALFDTLNVEAILPLEWIETHRAEVGGQVPFPLDLIALGLNEDAIATVTAIEPCPPIQPGPGRVVLTTINHLNPDVVELSLRNQDGRQEAVRPTGLHRFYSESREDWVRAEILTAGEQLRGLDGPITVDSIRNVPGVHRVYNMTVEADHVFHVSSLGVLSHNDNSCPPPGGATSPQIKAEDLAGKTRTNIRDLAGNLGLTPHGDPASPDFPRKWKDPVTGSPRVRLDRGHTDAGTGLPYDNPNAAGDHVHGYAPDGTPIIIDGDPHIPTTGE